MVELKHLLDLAEQVDALARPLGIETALIGALALAVRNYERATLDADLATAVREPGLQLRQLEDAVRAQGLLTALRLPDDDDDLGGVLDIGETADEDGDLVKLVQIVNFYNPYHPRKNPGTKAVARAELVDPSLGLRCVRLDDLVALKLDAGARKDQVDVVELLARNPDADLAEIRATCAPYEFAELLETLIAEAEIRRGTPFTR